MEGKVFFATAIVGLCAVGVEANGQGPAGQRFEEQVLPHQLLPEVVQFGITVRVGFVHPVLQVVDGVLAVLDFHVDTCVQGTFSAVAVSILLVQPVEKKFRRDYQLVIRIAC